MPPWLSAFIVLCLVVALGTYIIYGNEGFVSASPTSASPKSQLSCKSALSACQAACGGSDMSCWRKCGETATQCYAKSTAAATILASGPLQKGNVSSSGVMSWKNSAGSSTSIPNYYNLASEVYTSSPSPSASPSPSPSPESSPWDWNINKYFSGWPQQTFNFQQDGSYESSLPKEASYTPSVKKWKPHEIPTEELPGVTVDAPTDKGTVAADLRDSVLAPSLQQLIRDDAKDTVDTIFRNQYEIQYT
jgi:hypothetical protein